MPNEDLTLSSDFKNEVKELKMPPAPKPLAQEFVEEDLPLTNLKAKHASTKIGAAEMDFVQSTSVASSGRRRRNRCKHCKPGGGYGSAKLVRGRCRQWCSRWGYCGWSGAY